MFLYRGQGLVYNLTLFLLTVWHLRWSGIKKCWMDVKETFPYRAAVLPVLRRVKFYMTVADEIP